MFNQAQGLSTAAGIAFLVVTLAGSGAFARAMSADEGTTRLAIEYLADGARNGPPVPDGGHGRGTARHRQFQAGMIVQTATAIINIILAPILIFGWGTGIAMGVAGAALASCLAILFGVAWR